MVIRHILRLCVERLCWHNCANIQAWLRHALQWIWLLIGLLSLWFAVVVWVTSLGPAFHRDKAFCFRQQDNLRQYWGQLFFETDCLPAEKKAQTEAFPFPVVKFAKYKQKKKTIWILTPGWLTQIHTLAEVISWLTDTDQYNRQGWGLCNTLPNVYILHNDVTWWTGPILSHG